MKQPLEFLTYFLLLSDSFSYYCVGWAATSITSQLFYNSNIFSLFPRIPSIPSNSVFVRLWIFHPQETSAKNFLHSLNSLNSWDGNAQEWFIHHSLHNYTITQGCSRLLGWRCCCGLYNFFTKLILLDFCNFCNFVFSRWKKIQQESARKLENKNWELNNNRHHQFLFRYMLLFL